MPIRSRCWTPFVALSLLAVSACGGKDATDSSAVSVEPDVVFLSATDHLLRSSMLLRGIRPSLDEMDLIEQNPDAIEGLLDDWMTTEEFGETIRDMHAEMFLLRRDTLDQLPVKGILEAKGYDQDDLFRSTTEAPLRLVDDVVRNGRPYTEVVTGDYAYADQVVADIYGLPFDPDGPEWQQTRWVDGRPHAGLLSDSEIWRRHVSNAQNFHRGRANFISKTFLCEDIGGRDVVVEGGVALNDPEAVATAVWTQTSCIGCHQVLDPLAAFFHGYKEQLRRGAILQAYNMNCQWDWDLGEPPRGSYRIDHWCYPLRFYVVSDEQNWDTLGLRPPGYFGEPAHDVTDLGSLIADDPRFSQCTARNFASYFGEFERPMLPLTQASELQQVLEDNDFDVRELIKAIVLSDAWRIEKVTNDPDDSVFHVGLQVIRPEQYARTLYDLTGFRWLANLDGGGCAENGNNCWNAVDLLRSDLYGFRSMQGGIDGYTVTHPTHSPTPTKTMAMALAAQEAAGWVVDNDWDVGVDQRHLMGSIEPTTTDEQLIRAQLVWMHRRILGESLASDSPGIDLSWQLWNSAFVRTTSTDEAWKLLVSALLQDPHMTFF
jgi:hypothetical protein